MGYAARAVRHVTTYEYRAPCGLNHGLAVLHEEMSHYLIPPMLEDAAALLGDFIAMREAISAYQVQIRAHENQSAHLRQEARNAAFIRDKEDAHLRRELNEARTELRQVEAERDDAVSQLVDFQNTRRELQTHLSAKAAELRVSEGAVKQMEADKRQLEADLDEARRLQRAATTGPVEMSPVPRVPQSQALATSISRMTLGSTQSPASAPTVVQHALMPTETSSVRVTGARGIAHPTDSPYALQTVHGGCPCHPQVEYVSYGRACPKNASRTGRYHYQYRTYVPSPPPGYHVEDLPYPAAREPGRQPELCAVPVRREVVRFQPVSAERGEPELTLAQPPSAPVEPVYVPPAPVACEMDGAAAYPANTGPVCAVWPLPKPQGS